MTASAPLVHELCLRCGLCCNGYLFAGVELQPGDDAAQLRALGLPVSKPRSGNRPAKFPQPCSALCADNRCRIYSQRPTYCREFECAVLQTAQAGHRSMAESLRLIRLARRRAAKVLRLLRQLGNDEENKSLGQRFRKTVRRVSEAGLSGAEAHAFGELTVAYQQLTLLLSESFYPDPA